MLKALSVKNFTVIESVTLMPSRGMTVITGETGAGKSILIDALQLALGGRASTGVIREGASQASITLNIDLHGQAYASQWLAQRGLAEAGDCVLHRVIERSGRSHCWINGIPATTTQLRSLGSLLVDIFGQNSQQFLLQRGNHLGMLDELCEHQELLEKMKKIAHDWSDCSREHEAMEKNREGVLSRIDLLRYRASELDALAPEKGEFGSLENKHRVLSHQEKLKSCLATTLGHLDEVYDESCVTRLVALTKDLEAFSGLSPEIDTALELLHDSTKKIRIAGEELLSYKDKTDLSAARFQEVEARLSDHYRLADKYRTEPQKLNELWHSTNEELAQVEAPGEQLKALDERRQELRRRWLELAQAVGKNRRKLKLHMENKVRAALQKLNMPDSDVQVELKQRLDPDSSATHAQGLESAEFLVSTNPNQKTGSIAKIASGGELSRISLAFQLVASKAARVPVMVFDEADTGIGGASAEIVGRMLSEIGKHSQVLCVTHLPQIAVQADHHCTVQKVQEGGYSSASVKKLDKQEREQEIARMMAGVEITKHSLAHAKEMLNQSRTRN